MVITGSLTLRHRVSRVMKGHVCVCHHHHSSDFSPSAVCNAWAFVMVELILLWYFKSESFDRGLFFWRKEAGRPSLLQSCGCQSAAWSRDSLSVHPHSSIQTAILNYAFLMFLYFLETTPSELRRSTLVYLWLIRCVLMVHVMSYDMWCISDDNCLYAGVWTTVFSLVLGTQELYLGS